MPERTEQRNIYNDGIHSDVICDKSDINTIIQVIYNLTKITCLFLYNVFPPALSGISAAWVLQSTKMRLTWMNNNATQCNS